MINMCGILAVIGHNSKPDQSKFGIALEKQKYRGPDASRIESVTPDTLFGFNRLTIQDLSDSSMQPFAHNGNWIIFNGEIYNFKELREYLIEKGVQFSTTGDTEVLCAGLSIEGASFIEKLNGIFAFCFYDSKKSSYLVARDTMGIKPLFYASTSAALILSSDIKSILEYVEPEINMAIVYRQAYLDWFIGHNQTETFFKNIYSLPRGTYREYDTSGTILQEKFFGTIDFSTTVTDLSKAETDFKSLLQDSLRIETRSDTPVGILLSGGIDSSTITAFATPFLMESQQRIPIFTFYYETAGERDDLVYSEEVLEDLRKIYGDVFDFYGHNMDAALSTADFEDSVSARSIPVSDIRQISLVHLYRSVHEKGIKVILNGQGSDELYYGYYPLDYWMSRFYRQGDFTAPNVLDYFGKELNLNKHNAFKEDFLANARSVSEKYLEERFATIPETITEKEKRVSFFFLETILQTLLQYEDKGSMFSSIEVRVPLINRLLVEYAAKCDFTFNLVSSTSGRHLMRKALEGTLREHVISRPKSPAPKKKKYTKELQTIYEQCRSEVLLSPLLNSMYKSEFLENPFGATSESEYAFYGNLDDTILEMLGFYFFEKEFLLKN